MNLLAIDPGVLSGICWAGHPGPGELVDIGWREADQRETCGLIEQWCAEVGPEGVLIIEAFTPRGGPIKFQPASLEIIGVARWYAYKHHVRFVVQRPGDMKQIRPDAVERWPEVGRGGKGHAKDALGHLWLFA